MTSAPQAYRVILDLTISSSVGFDAGHLSKVDRSYALRRQRTQHIVGLAWLGLPAMSLARVCILRAFSSLSIEIERPRFRDRVLLHHLHSPVPSCPLPNNFPSLLKCSAWTSLLGATSNPSRRLAPTLHCNRPWDSEVSCSCGNIPETTLLTNRLSEGIPDCLTDHPQFDSRDRGPSNTAVDVFSHETETLSALHHSCLEFPHDTLTPEMSD